MKLNTCAYFLILRYDIGSGRNETDLVSAKTTRYGKTFDSICYSADGEAIIAGNVFLFCYLRFAQALPKTTFQQVFEWTG